MATTVITLTNTETTSEQFKAYQGDKYVCTNRIIDHLGGMCAGTRQSTMSVYTNGRDSVAASGTLTCASAAVGDTAVINGVTLTAMDGRNTSTVAAVADSSGSLNNTYFTLSSPSANYYVWFNVNSAGTDPALAGKTAIPVALATNAANTVVSAAINTAINLVTGVFTSTNSSHTATIKNVAGGTCTATADGAAPTGFTINTTNAGAAPTAVQFQVLATDTLTGGNLAATINASANALIANLVTAVNASGVVTVTSTTPSAPSGNMTTIAGTGGVSASGARLTGGTLPTANVFHFGM